jgi:hypothetical protein
MAKPHGIQRRIRGGTEFSHGMSPCRRDMKRFADQKENASGPTIRPCNPAPTRSRPRASRYKCRRLPNFTGRFKVLIVSYSPVWARPHSLFRTERTAGWGMGEGSPETSRMVAPTFRRADQSDQVVFGIGRSGQFGQSVTRESACCAPMSASLTLLEVDRAPANSPSPPKCLTKLTKARATRPSPSPRPADPAAASGNSRAVPA